MVQVQIKYRGKVIKEVEDDIEALSIENGDIESIRDIEGLESLNELRDLSLENNSIEKIDFPSKMNNLCSLNLD
ncbi:MAG: hypothetical protein JW839_17355, partial [Candidatus Lokiarchaeota archaeon]|nr:hypothetical protein [Candidatus Lokiarchaeota archaeon]